MDEVLLLHMTPVFLFLLCFSCVSLVPTASVNTNHACRAFHTIPYTFLILGVPNVGKSSLINAIRKQVGRVGKKAAKEGALPGVTRHLSAFQVSNNPPCILLDTPGVMIPHIENNEQAFKLALVQCVKAFGSGNWASGFYDQMLADFLLFQLNHHKQYQYVKAFGLPQPNDDIEQVLSHIANKVAGNFEQQDEHVQYNSLERAALYMLQVFRQGGLGQVTLDDIIEPDSVTTGPTTIDNTSIFVQSV